MTERTIYDVRKDITDLLTEIGEGTVSDEQGKMLREYRREYSISSRTEGKEERDPLLGKIHSSLERHRVNLYERVNKRHSELLIRSLKGEKLSSSEIEEMSHLSDFLLLDH